MTRFERLTRRSIPEASKPGIETISERYGFVPNLVEGLARAPAALDGYRALSAAFEGSTLAPEEQQIVLLTASRLNQCGYCTSVHSLTAESTELAWDTIERIRNREPLANERYEALRTFTERLIEHRGAVPGGVWAAFTAAGFDERAALEVIVGVTLKTLTNTVNHLVDTPLDQRFEKRRWTADEARAVHA